MKLNIFGYKFSQNDERLSWSELIEATKSNTEANVLIKKAKSNRTVYQVLGFIGGALIGIPIGQAISNENPNWTLAYIGGGISIASIPFSFSAFNKVNKGIDKYNLSLKSASVYQFKPEFNFAINSNGVGLTMNF
ncbi:hypothetical protein [Winogradskyella sp. A3E31]|uniref:hypothetical protein n=1 Tax=Winogradskyella sp. A3E31 TaxID=3349637 RepID=UPI00398B580B